MIRVKRITIECDETFNNLEELEKLRMDIRERLGINGSMTVFRYEELTREEPTKQPIVKF